MLMESASRVVLIEMFEKMVVAKNSDLVAHYYHPDFVLETNGQRQDFADFAEGHRRIYATDISYAVRYDDEAWVEAGERLAARVWIDIRKPGAAPVTFEVVLIALFRDGRILKLWETTWPDWREDRSFEDYGGDAG